MYTLIFFPGNAAGKIKFLRSLTHKNPNSILINQANTISLWSMFVTKRKERAQENKTKSYNRYPVLRVYYFDEAKIKRTRLC